MKLFAIVLVGCLYLSAETQADKLLDLEGFYYEQRHRLGHFSEEPFADLYLNYATAFVKPKHEERANDDFRNYLPSGDECMEFFRSFRINEYQVRTLSETVLMDACLGYLYDSDEYHEKDKSVSQLVQDYLEENQEDVKLKELYHQTQIDHLSAEAKDCVGGLLYNSIKAQNQFSDEVCNHHWIHLLNNFAHCQNTTITDHQREHDPYLVKIYELVKSRGQECFTNEIATLNFAVRKAFASDKLFQVQAKLSTNKLTKQSGERLWPKPIAKLLAVVQGSPSEINLRRISNILLGIVQDRPIFKKTLLENMEMYADATIKPKREDKATKLDPTGAKRYDDIVDGLCNYFRRSDSRRNYDFFTPLKRMVDLLKYEKVFGITRKDFRKQVVIEGFEINPLYSSVYACNILTFTEGSFAVKNPNGPNTYKVVFKRDTSTMLRWPDAGFY